MRQKTVECETVEQAQDMCPWASRFAKVTDGYKCFESIEDYETWMNQK